MHLARGKRVKSQELKESGDNPKLTCGWPSIQQRLGVKVKVKFL